MFQIYVGWTNQKVTEILLMQAISLLLSLYQGTEKDPFFSPSNPSGNQALKPGTSLLMRIQAQCSIISA
jgi:hypothetical protein